MLGARRPVIHITVRLVQSGGPRPARRHRVTKKASIERAQLAGRWTRGIAKNTRKLSDDHLPSSNSQEAAHKSRIERGALELLDKRRLMKGNAGRKCLRDDALALGDEFWGQPKAEELLVCWPVAVRSWGGVCASRPAPRHTAAKARRRLFGHVRRSVHGGGPRWDKEGGKKSDIK